MSEKTPNLAFVAEDGVPQRRTAPATRGRARNPKIEQYINTLCNAKPGQSFFFPGLKRTDVEFLRRPATTAGINLTIRELDRDDIHLVAGVRIWRESGEFDEL